MLIEHLIAPDMEDVLSNYYCCCFVIVIFWRQSSSLWGWELGIPGGSGSREGHVFKACRIYSLSALRGVSGPFPR